MLNALDVWALNLYVVTNISHYRHWNSCQPYISSYYITSELHISRSNTNTRNNDPFQNNNNNDNNDNNNDNISNNNNNNNNNNKNDFNNNISKYYWKMRKNDIFCFHNFGGAIAAQVVYCHPRVIKGVIKLQEIISKHKQAFIPTTI